MISGRELENIDLQPNQSGALQLSAFHGLRLRASKKMSAEG